MQADLEDDIELTEGQDMPGDAAAEPDDEAIQIKAALVQALGFELKAEFDKRRGDRREIEQRWHKDLAQYNGVYEGETKAAIEARKFGSQVFVPLTRRIANVVEAKWGDLMFPTDERNFAVQASPEQDLAEAQALAAQLGDQAVIPVGGLKLSAAAVRAALIELRQENERKATNMQRVIDDQLKESRYAGEARKAIHNAIKLGTGILKGPFVLGRVKKKWLRVGGRTVLQISESFAAAVTNVDPWNYFPDLSTGDIEAMSGHYELHPMNKAQLAALARQPGFDAEAIAQILSVGPDMEIDSANRAAQTEAAGTVGVQRNGYNLVEYNGPVDHDKLVAWGVNLPEDPLLVYNAVVWFHESSGRVLKAILNPMDTEEQPYCVLNWQQDTACVFGYGVPYELRDTQEAGNSTFRAMLDNMGLSVGGQTVVNDKLVVPANGRWEIEPNKVWRLKDSAVPVQNVFGFYQVASLATELLTIFNTIKGVAEEIGGPAMAMQGSEAPSYLQAGATGVAMAFNAANVWMRRAVRNFDDQVTVPMIGRFINWNMQYHPDDDIKGDLSALARGTSALLEAEGYAGRVQVLAKLSAEAGVPIRRIVAQLRKIAVSMRLDRDELLPDDAEIKEMEEERRRQGPPRDPEMERMKLRELELQDRKADREHQMMLADKNAQVRLAEIASKEGLTIEAARQKYGFEAIREAARMEHETQAMNAELAARYQTGAGI